MIKVLLIEDDEEIAKVIKYYLYQEDTYEVTWAKDAHEALYLSRDEFDVILLDVMLPDDNGINLCGQLREFHQCPILFISCLDDSETIIHALEMGGDDYLVKPFDTKILDAKIKANLRRVQIERNEKIENKLECNGFMLDAQTHTLIKENHQEALIQIEFRLLAFFMMHPNVCYKSSELYKHIWGKSSYGDNRTVVVHIHNIRKKIEDDPSNPRYLKNKWGKGYFFDPQGELEEKQ
ncbi:MAG: response regulator transcription factor [Erysipelotrichales bacterium]